MKGRLQLIAFVVARTGRRAVRRVAEPLLRRVASGSRSPGGGTIDALAGLMPDTSTRLLIGPANSAGQGYLWARAIERELPGVGVVAMGTVPPGAVFGFSVDQAVPVEQYRWSPDWSRAQRTAAMRFTHILAESGRPLFGDAGHSPFAELDALRSAGVRVGLVFHGSDLRSPSRHADGSAWSPYREPWSIAPLLELRVRENLALVERLGEPAFVTTPDLLDELPDAEWLPVVIDPAAWSSSTPPLTRDRVVVAHAPSNPRMKGTALIEPVLHRLETEGVIERAPFERVPSTEMPARYARVDVVLDQFRIGAYGVAAVEALAAGRLVVANVTPAVRDRISTLSGRELPIEQADPATLEGVLRAIAADPAAYRERAARGPAFAEQVHGGAYSARVLRGFLTR